MIVIKSLDNTRHAYEMALRIAGSQRTNLAFARAMNRGVTTTRKQISRALARQSSIKSPIVNERVKLKKATANNLQTVFYGHGSGIRLDKFTASRFKAGVKATIWAQKRLVPASEPSRGFKHKGRFLMRTTKARLPIKGLFGPSIGKELPKDQSLEAFNAATPQVAERAMHELKQILKLL